MYRDTETGVEIRRVTHMLTTHHLPFYTVPAYDSEMRRLFYIGYRNERPQIFCEVLKTGEHCRLTDENDLDEWSVHPSNSGDYVYFTSGNNGYRVNVNECRTEQISEYSNPVISRDKQRTGFGTTALSRDDRRWAVQYTDGKFTYLTVTDTATKKTEIILKTDEIAHMQFSPDGNALFYADKNYDRVWCVNRDGTGNRVLIESDKEHLRLTNGSFIMNTDELALINRNKGIIAVNVKDGNIRRVSNVNAWHAVSSYDGAMMAADTNYPDIGIVLLDPGKRNGKKFVFCHPESSNMDEQRQDSVTAAEQTHPHPRFSPDNRFIVFNSDKSGCPQVYEARLPQHFKGPV